MRAIQAEDFSTPPYWFESITDKIACLRSFSIINSSATLEITGVREMGLRSLLISLTGLVLGMVITLALFQLVGTVSSLNEQLRIDEIGVARIAANLFRTHELASSGPEALLTCSWDSLLNASDGFTWMADHHTREVDGHWLLDRSLAFFKFGYMKRHFLHFEGTFEQNI